ncbi:MAG TPA: hypothetical protein VF189_04140 [Patescibacteria group bacterium]
MANEGEKSPEEKEQIREGARNEIFYLNNLRRRKSNLSRQETNFLDRRIQQINDVLISEGMTTETMDEITRHVLQKGRDLNNNRGWLHGGRNNRNSRLT